jgi:hypothetical protein
MSLFLEFAQAAFVRMPNPARRCGLFSLFGTHDGGYANGTIGSCAEVRLSKCISVYLWANEV